MEVSPYRRNYFRLMIALSVLGCLYPMLDLRDAQALGQLIWTLSFWVLLYVALRAIRVPRRQLQLARVLMISALGFGAGKLFLASQASLSAFAPIALAGSWLLSLLFLSQVSWAVLMDVLASGRVEVQRIFGAVCVYILMALCWAHVHALLEYFQPGSLKVDPGLGWEAPDGMSLMLYYSFVTITTLGYGDVVPVHGLSRLFAGAEALMGQLYLTVVVARLIGLHISHDQAPREAGRDDDPPRP